MPQQGDSIETLYVDIAARADQLIQQAEEATKQVVRGLGQIEDKARETESVFSKVGSFIKDAFTVATGIGLASVGQSLIRGIADIGRSMISANAQMQTFEQSFTVLTGSAQEAGEIIEWVKEQAKATPFDVPGLINASQMLMTWGLDLKEWFTVVGDVAAGMNRPLSQVVNAVGTLASGQTGEAVRRFRDLGINLREFEALEFDAQGSLITPLQEAIPIVKQIMVDRFGGMMEAQSKTWSGVMSNLGDTWQEFVRTLGEPVFETLNEALLGIQEWINENQEQIEAFARTLGEGLSNALNIMKGLLERIGAFINAVDQGLNRLFGEDYLGRAVTAYRQIEGIFQGTARGSADFWGGIIGGESVSEAFSGAKTAMRETMLDVAGVREESEELEEVQRELTQAQLAGVAAVRQLGDAYSALTDQEIAATFEEISDEQANFVTGILDLAGTASSILPPAYQELIESSRDVITTTLEEKQVFDEAVEGYIAAEEAAAAYADEQERIAELAREAADALTDRLDDAMKRFQETVEEATTATQEAIDEIAAEAAEAETAAIARHQEQVAQLRDEFAREQLRRRRQFNLEWARLIRDQNQEVIDAEWEYQFAKENLLIEGDEIALAELEARYKHEQEVRAREQGDARDDMLSAFEEETQANQERLDARIQALEAQLEQELEKVRQEAREETAAKEEALQERIANEEERLAEHYVKLGEMLYDRVNGEQDAANQVLGAWSQMYTDLDTLAIQSAFVARQELQSILDTALQATQAINLVPSRPGGGGPRPGRPGGGRHSGGYSPPTPGASVQTLPGEYMLSPTTTAALEGAVGGSLTQENVKRLAGRAALDINITGSGLRAGEVELLRRDLTEAVEALMQETEE